MNEDHFFEKMNWYSFKDIILKNNLYTIEKTWRPDFYFSS